ncbi:MAG: heterocyst frequency control protein PatD [Cyanosarcina radialis HA8281-LM2]|jgi:hypothetical protein|nr:heterocyst frequency control protein PatD [Cyanosarcina radialis HA8281-LM2]
MLPTSPSDYLQQFLRALEQLQARPKESQPQAFSQVQEIFERQVINFNTEGLDPASASKVRSYLTEMHKQMRLLQTDMAFLQSARSDATAQARQTSVRDRLSVLIGYCQTLLTIMRSP